MFALYQYSSGALGVALHHFTPLPSPFPATQGFGFLSLGLFVIDVLFALMALREHHTSDKFIQEVVSRSTMLTVRKCMPTDTQPPPADTQPPSSDAQPPSADTQSPSADTQPPSADTQSPSAASPTHSAGSPTHSAGSQTPSAGSQPPSPQIELCEWSCTAHTADVV